MNYVFWSSCFLAATDSVERSDDRELAVFLHRHKKSSAWVRNRFDKRYEVHWLPEVRYVRSPFVALSGNTKFRGRVWNRDQLSIYTFHLSTRGRTANLSTHTFLHEKAGEVFISTLPRFWIDRIFFCATIRFCFSWCPAVELNDCDFNSLTSTWGSINSPCMS